MVFDQIEALKREYTDKYVVVDESRPELARFRGVTGIVKTVNMSGRALIEFQDYIANIGWFDIELDFLTVVPKPDPSAAAGHGEKPAAAKAKPAAGESKAAAAKPVAAAKPAAAKPTGGKQSTAEILAAARAKKAATTAPAAESTAPAEQSAPAAAEVAETATIAAKPAAAAPMKTEAKPIAAGAKPTTTAEKVAYCRRVDAKG